TSGAQPFRPQTRSVAAPYPRKVRRPRTIVVSPVLSSDTRDTSRATLLLSWAVQGSLRPPWLLPVGMALAFVESAGRHEIMLRITIIESAAPSKTLKLEGRIAGTLVEEMRRLCNELLSSNHAPLILDLSDVSFIDTDGIELMRELTRRNVVVTNY